MRIVMICAEYPPNHGMGGIGTYVATVAPPLARRDHDVHVITKGSGTVAIEDGVTVHRIRPRWLLTRLKMSVLARRLRPDVVHAAEWGSEGWLLARGTRVPVVTRLATPTYVIEELNHVPKTWRSRLSYLLERDQTRRSGAVYAPTRAIIDRVERDWALPEGRIQLLVNPVDIGAIRRAGAGKPPIPLPDRFLVYFGGLERRKGIEELARAAARVLASDEELHLVCIGYRGPDDVMADFDAHVAPVKDRVHLLDELPRRDALATVARAEVVVLPSHWESFGYTCVEALALCRPVVATNRGGYPEIATDGVHALLVPPRDAEALERGIREVLADPEAARRRTEAGRRRADEFDVGRIVDTLDHVLDRTQRPVTSAVYRENYRTHFDPEASTNPFRDLYREKRELVLDHFATRPRSRVLDVGGGFGRLAAPLSTGHEVTLCDLAPDMVAEAHRRCGPSVHVVRADGRALPFPDESFDALVAMDLLVHLGDLTDGLRELARVLRPGGELVVDTTNAAPWWVLAYPDYWQWRPDRLVRTMAGQGVQPAWRHTVRHQHAREARAALAEAGLVIEATDGLGPSWCPKWHVWWTRKPA